MKRSDMVRLMAEAISTKCCGDTAWYDIAEAALAAAEKAGMRPPQYCDESTIKGFYNPPTHKWEPEEL